VPVLEVQRRVKAHPDLVWSIVADLGGAAGVPPAATRVEVLEGQRLGLIRRVLGKGGYAWLEECTEWVELHRYTMSVAAREFPVSFARLSYTCCTESDAQDGTVLLRLYFDYQSRFGVLGRLTDRISRLQRLQVYANQLLESWVSIIHAREWAHRVTVQTILNEKGGHVHALRPGHTVRDAVNLLSEQRIGSVLVMANEDAGEPIAGVVSERDVVRGLAEMGGAVLQQPVTAIMTQQVIVAGPGDNMMMVMASMSENRVRHLPVVEAGRVLGLVSIGDVIKARMSELESQSDALRDYIAARRWHDLYREIGPAAYADEAVTAPDSAH
jgi:CBS domain-containing protein